MLKELQEFASKGCIDIAQVRNETEQLKQFNENLAGNNNVELIQEKKAKVLQLINQLREQMRDLEKFAYENGHGEMPLSELKQRQVSFFVFKSIYGISAGK